MQKPSFKELRELQREFLLLRWRSICSRGDQAFYARSIDTHVVSNALGGSDGVAHPSATTRGGDLVDPIGARHSLPSVVDAASPYLSSAFLFADAATCGLLARRRQFTDFVSRRASQLG